MDFGDFKVVEADSSERTLAHLGGVPAEILYDRMKNVFIKKLAGRGQFTQGLMTLADHYGFEREVAPAYSPWVKDYASYYTSLVVFGVTLLLLCFHFSGRLSGLYSYRHSFLSL